MPEGEAEPEILVVCINYHNEEETVSFVRSLLRQELPGSLRVAVVDNGEAGSGDPALKSLTDDPGVSVRRPGRNLGYFGGAAWGLRRHLEEAPTPEWVVVSNTDILFPDTRFFARLAERHPADESAIVAPKILSSVSRRDQNPYMPHRPPALRMHFYKWAFRYYPIYTAYHALSFAKRKLAGLTGRNAGPPEAPEREARPQSIYAPHGAFVLFHRSYFEAGGNLDHGALLYGEEVFVAETARRLGLAVSYDPGLAVLHREHATTGTFKSRKVARFQWEASAYCADTFFKR